MESCCFTDERLIGQPGVPVLVRRFRPSTVEVSGIQEALVDPNASNQMESLAQSVSTLSGIPVQRLAFTEVSCCSTPHTALKRNFILALHTVL